MGGRLEYCLLRVDHKYQNRQKLLVRMLDTLGTWRIYMRGHAEVLATTHWKQLSDRLQKRDVKRRVCSIALPPFKVLDLNETASKS